MYYCADGLAVGYMTITLTCCDGQWSMLPCPASDGGTHD